MASHQNSFASSTLRGNCSKAQNCLFKILKIISTLPPDNNTPPSQNLNGFAIDLNIGFHLPAEESGSPVDGSFVTASAAFGNFADEKSSAVAECGGVDFEKCPDDDGEEKSCESDVVQLQSTENQEEIGELKQQQGFMDLLIQAATLIFGDFNSKSECETDTRTFKLDNNHSGDKLNTDEQQHEKKQLKRGSSEYTEEVIEDKSSYPLIRSKRGRIQVLPNKYRDSILEPLTPLSRIRSTIVPSRRRSK